MYNLEQIVNMIILYILYAANVSIKLRVKKINEYNTYVEHVPRVLQCNDCCD